MPDTKITALAAITTVDPAADVLPIVDISDTSMAASGTTKKITSNQILGAGGTATLASATITGDLTVDTSTLKVDSANDRVGIGIATPAWPLDIRSATAVAQILSTTGTNAAYLQVSNTGGIFYLGRENSAGTSFASPAYSAVLYAGGAYPLVTTVNGSERYRIASDGVATWSNVGGVAGTAMTLNATGLGVGVTPLGRLHVRQSGAGIQDVGLLENAQAAAADVGPRLGLLGVGSVAMATVESGWNGAANTDAYLSFRTRGSGAVTERLRIDSSGNVGIGVTPSALSGFGTTLRQKGVGAAGGIFTENNTGASWFGIYSGTSTSDAAAVTFTDGGSLRFAKTTAVGVTGFTELLRLKNGGQLRFVPLASDPAGAEAGDVYYNSTSNKLKCYNGTTWNDLF